MSRRPPPEPAAAMRRSRGRPERGAGPDPEHVLRTALTIFAERGFDDATLRAIAAAAGVDQALVSRRYGSKLGLWKAAVDAVSIAMCDAQDSMAACQAGAAGSAERLVIAIEHFVGFSCRYPELHRFFTREAATPGERRDYVLDRIWWPHEASLLPAMARAEEDGHLPSGVTARSALVMMMGAVALSIEMERSFGPGLDLPQAPVSARLARDIVALLRR